MAFERHHNIDAFGNDIFDMSGRRLRGRSGRANIRVWGNRIHNAAHNGISHQPQNDSPWYILRNQLVGSMEAPFKFRTTDRSVIAHNTIVMWGSMICCSGAHLLRSIVKNNLWVSVSGGQIWDFGSAVKDWRRRFQQRRLRLGGEHGAVPLRRRELLEPGRFPGAASGLETNGRQFSRAACFATFSVLGPAPVPIPPQHLTLKAGCNVLDAGAILPNINDGFVGAAARDLGAFELGQPAPNLRPTAGDTAATDSADRARRACESRADPTRRGGP